jgi:hypothetical protein
MHTTRVDRRPREVIHAEDALTSYQNANYGPMWGDTNEREADSLTRALVALYAKHNILSDDRLAGL